MPISRKERWSRDINVLSWIVMGLATISAVGGGAFISVYPELISDEVLPRWAAVTTGSALIALVVGEIAESVYKKSRE